MAELFNWNQRNERGRDRINLRAAKQLTDDTWERLLCALERLEYLTEGSSRGASAMGKTRDLHSDKGNVNVSVYHAELEVQLQIQAFQYVVSPIREEKEILHWLLKDFAEWMAGRQGLAISATDEYAIPVIKSIRGENFSLPHPSSLPRYKGTERPNPTQADIQKTYPIIVDGQNRVREIEEQFNNDSGKQATQTYHVRGQFQDGISRIQEIAEALREDRWFKVFATDLHQLRLL